MAADPTFALAHFIRFAIQVRMGNPAAALESIQKAMEYKYRLAERFQYQVKGEYFGMQQDFEKMYAVYEMWAELYPQDIQAQRAAVDQLIQVKLAQLVAPQQRACALKPLVNKLAERVRRFVAGVLLDLLQNPRRTVAAEPGLTRPHAQPEIAAQIASLAEAMDGSLEYSRNDGATWFTLVSPLAEISDRAPESVDAGVAS